MLRWIFSRPFEPDLVSASVGKWKFVNSVYKTTFPYGEVVFLFDALAEIFPLIMPAFFRRQDQ
ncbi:hypothetical protein J2Z37_002742 [Ammoniphilus resinae]|uniref:Uncharacterized protein n=1 Tax=Ammoniphilus resinae TaxID=861532 RepID=A0ABS4GR47_9BACL|nr:hypothetical protein [Ammoniphilus resinae]